MAGVVPDKAVLRPARGMGGQGEIQDLLAIAQGTAQVIPIVDAGLDEARQFFQLGAADGGLDVERFEVIAEMRINVFVVVTLGQFAQFPFEPLAAGVVNAAGTPAIAAPVAEAVHDGLEFEAVDNIDRAALPQRQVMGRVK